MPACRPTACAWNTAQELGFGDSRVEVQDAKLQFGGRRLGWQVDSGQLQLTRLRLEMLERRLELEQLALQLKGSRGATTLAAQLRWPQLDVQGDQLQGSAVDGSLTLGGDRRLQMTLSSQPPSGAFERITLPELHLVLDGQFGSSALKGQADATLLLEPQTLAATLDALSLRLQVDDPGLPALQLALQGQAQLTPDSGSGRLEGTINDQRVDARFDAQLDRVRPFIDLQANIGTLDLNRFASPAQRGAAPAPAAAAMPIHLQPLRAVDARLRLNVARLLRPPYRIDALALQASIDNGRLDVQRLTGRAWGGSFDASGSADANTDSLALRLRAEQVDMRALLADTTGYDGLRGRARIEADLQGRGVTVGAVRSSLGGTARLSLQPAALRGVDLAQTLRGWRTATQDQLTSDATRQTDFSQLEGSFNVRNGVARNDDLDGRSDFLRISGEGTHRPGAGPARLPAAHARDQHRQRACRAGDDDAQRRHRAGAAERALRQHPVAGELGRSDGRGGRAVGAQRGARHRRYRDARRHGRGARRGRDAACHPRHRSGLGARAALSQRDCQTSIAAARSSSALPTDLNTVRSSTERRPAAWPRHSAASVPRTSSAANTPRDIGPSRSPLFCSASSVST